MQTVKCFIAWVGKTNQYAVLKDRYVETLRVIRIEEDKGRITEEQREEALTELEELYTERFNRIFNEHREERIKHENL